VAAVVSISGIDEAIKNLDYKAKDSPKLRLIRAIRAHYAGDSTLTTLQTIDPDILVREVWDTAFDDHRLRSRRKNLAGIRSSVNADLKRLFENGKNPDGIIIGSSNTFVMSDEAKDQMLTSIAASVRKDGHVSLGQITRTLSVIDDLLAQTERFIKAEDDDRDSGIRRLKQLIEQISKRVDLDAGEGRSQGDGISPEGTGVGPGPQDGLGQDRGGDFHDGSGSSGMGAGAEGSGGESAGPGSETGGRDGLVPEEVSAEEEEFEEVEVVDEPDDLEVVDETSAEGIGGSTDGFAAAEGAFQELPGGGGLGRGPGADLAGEGYGLSEGPWGNGAHPEGTGGGPGPQYGPGQDQVGDFHDGSGSTGMGAGAEGSGGESAGSGSGAVGNDEFIPQEVSAEDLELEEVEVADEPDDLEDLDEVIEEADDSDVEALEEAQLAESENGEEFESGAGSGPGTQPSGVDQGRDRAAAPEVGLPLGSLGLDAFADANQNSGAAQETDHHLLAEAFDGYLGAMERFYNQYVLIPKGVYTAGGGNAALGHPERQVRLPEFYAGKFPVTNALFEIFVEKTGYLTTAEKEGYGVVYQARRKRGMDERTGRERVIWNAALVSQRVDGACWYQPLGPGSTLHRKRNHPVVQVSLEDAAAFAAWTGKRLPSEAEWEAAARSGDGRLYPWGDAWVDDRCNVEEAQVGDTTPVDAHMEAAGPFGIADTLGNVMEWTPDRDQTGENSYGSCYIVKGGSWASTSDICLCSRFMMEPDTRSNILGFRCVAS
jgi:formylglycine-generating enzyme required for sulfatase activity